MRKKRIEYIRRDKTRASEKEEDREYQERSRASEKEEDRVYQETKQEQVRKKRIEYRDKTRASGS